MAVIERILNFFGPAAVAVPEPVVPAPHTVYAIRPLTDEQLKEVMRLNLRCFPNGESYTKYTFNYLLSDPMTLSYRIVTESGEMAAFAFVMVSGNGSAHLTTIGVAPEHRRRGLAHQMLDHIETALKRREIGMLMLEVRVSNIGAQELYRSRDHYVVQRINRYYNDGEDCFLMMKALL